MKGCLVTFAALLALFLTGVVLPSWLIGIGIEDFEGPERRMASRALFYGPELYGSGFLEIGDYNGPPLVLGWHVDGVEKCPPLPRGEKPEADSYRAYAGGAPRSARTPSSASLGARWRSPAGAAGSGSRTSENPLHPKFAESSFHALG